MEYIEFEKNVPLEDTLKKYMPQMVESSHAYGKSSEDRLLEEFSRLITDPTNTDLSDWLTTACRHQGSIYSQTYYIAQFLVQLLMTEPDLLVDSTSKFKKLEIQVYYEIYVLDLLVYHYNLYKYECVVSKDFNDVLYDNLATRLQKHKDDLLTKCRQSQISPIRAMWLMALDFSEQELVDILEQVTDKYLRCSLIWVAGIKHWSNTSTNNDLEQNAYDIGHHIMNMYQTFKHYGYYEDKKFPDIEINYVIENEEKLLIKIKKRNEDFKNRYPDHESESESDQELTLDQKLLKEHPPNMRRISFHPFYHIIYYLTDFSQISWSFPDILETLAILGTEYKDSLLNKSGDCLDQYSNLEKLPSDLVNDYLLLDKLSKLKNPEYDFIEKSQMNQEQLDKLDGSDYYGIPEKNEIDEWTIDKSIENILKNKNYRGFNDYQPLYVLPSYYCVNGAFVFYKTDKVIRPNPSPPTQNFCFLVPLVSEDESIIEFMYLTGEFGWKLDNNIGENYFDYHGQPIITDNFLDIFKYIMKDQDKEIFIKTEVPDLELEDWDKACDLLELILSKQTMNISKFLEENPHAKWKQFVHVFELDLSDIHFNQN